MSVDTMGWGESVLSAWTQVVIALVVTVPLFCSANPPRSSPSQFQPHDARGRSASTDTPTVTPFWSRAGGMRTAQTTTSCRAKQRCKDYGECTWGDGFAVAGVSGLRGRLGCWVGSSNDCRSARACVKWGKCSKRSEFSQCVALTSADCSQSQVCRQHGWCNARNFGCTK